MGGEAYWRAGQSTGDAEIQEAARGLLFVNALGKAFSITTISKAVAQLTLSYTST